MTFFGNKAGSLLNSSRQGGAGVSASSDNLRKSVDTPQFRRSEISNRQRSQASHNKEEDPYYEMTDNAILRKTQQMMALAQIQKGKLLAPP